MESATLKERECVQLPVQIGPCLKIPYPMLERIIEERHKNLATIEKNNHLVAVSVLKSCVVSFLQFESSFKSLLAKGDSNTQIAIIKCAIEELRAANHSYHSLMDKNDPYRFFIIEPAYIVDLRELFLHCIKILVFMLHLLGGKDTSLDNARSNNWQGWHQVAEQIALSNNVLSSLVMRHVSSFETKPTSDPVKHFQSVVQEVHLFSSSVSHVTDSFLESRYPTKERILQIYDTTSIDIRRYITTRTSSSSSSVTGKEMQNNTTEKKTGSSWF